MRIRIFKEKPGVLGHDYIWVAMEGPYLYLHNHLIGLFWEIITGWRKDRNLAG